MTTMKQFGSLISFIVLPLLLILTGTNASAQLPEAFNGWETNIVRSISPPQLPQFSPEDAGVIREFGFASGEYRSYRKQGAELSVTLWKMKDATGAYGLYSYHREPGTASFHGDDPIAVWSNRLLIQHGPYVVDARSGKFTLGDAKLLLARIPTLRPEETTLPNLPSYFPEKNLVAQTEHYILGPIAFQHFVEDISPSAIGFETGAEAQVAQYSMDGSKPRLLLISYATPQMAIKKGRELAQLRGKDGSALFVDRKSSLIAIVLSAGSADVAKQLVASIPYEGKVTWSEYVPKPRDNIGYLVTNVFLLTGIILLFSLVAGLSFGGIRIINKKFFRRQLFDRPSEMEIIRLRLSDQ